MNSNFNCSYMSMSSLTYILGFSEIFSASLFRLGILWENKSHQNLLLRNLSSFWFTIKQKLTTKETSIFSNSSHLEWRAGLLDTILKGDHPRTIPAKFALIWFWGFNGRTTTDTKWWPGELKKTVPLLDEK